MIDVKAVRFNILLKNYTRNQIGYLIAYRLLSLAKRERREREKCACRGEHQRTTDALNSGATTGMQKFTEK